MRRFLGGELADPVDELELQTGRWTLRLLAATLAITPVRKLIGWNWLIKYRRPLGLFAFFYAVMHVTTFLYVQHRFVWGDIVSDVIEHKYVIVGTLALLSMIPLAITSTKGWIRRLGKNWQRLHRLVYVTAVLGTIHYLWAVKKDTTAPLVYLTIFVVLIGLRLFWIRRPGSAAKSAARSAAARDDRATYGDGEEQAAAGS